MQVLWYTKLQTFSSALKSCESWLLFIWIYFGLQGAHSSITLIPIRSFISTVILFEEPQSNFLQKKTFQSLHLHCTCLSFCTGNPSTVDIPSLPCHQNLAPHDTLMTENTLICQLKFSTFVCLGIVYKTGFILPNPES